MTDQENGARLAFRFAIDLMEDKEVARHCDAMGWTDDPVVRALVERLLVSAEAVEGAHETGWLQGLARAEGMASQVQSEIEECPHCDTTYAFDQLICDFQNEPYCGPDDDEPVKRAPATRKKRNQGTYLNAILAALQESSPRSGPAIFKAVRASMGEHARQKTTSTALSKAIEDGKVEKLPGRLYSIPTKFPTSRVT